MQIERVIDAKETIRKLTPEEEFAGKNVMQQCLTVKSGEEVLIITDPAKLKPEAAIFFEAAKQFTNKLKLISFSGMTENAQEPPSEVAEEMKQADVALLVTSYSLSHTNSRHQSSQAGTRIASMPGITNEMILRTLSIDYKQIAQLSKEVAAVLTAGKKALLSAANGTEAVFGLEGRDGIPDTGLFTNPGDFGNLPAGEAFIAPMEGTTEGIIVFDAGFANIKVDQEVRLLVEKGKVKDLQGGESARLFAERLARVGKRGYNIAELGVGTNRMAKLGSEVLEVEKVYETVHVALGNNATIGGEVDVPFHSDGVILSPTLRVDDTYILKNGKFVL